MSNVLVGVTGGIAAYKAIDFVNGLTKTGNVVSVIMTKNAIRFINPINFFNADVFTDEDEWDQHNGGILHIELAKWADAFAVYPATANTIAKLNHGMADNLLTTTWLACTSKKIVFPAMNTEMLKNRITKINLDALNLHRRNIKVMGTEEGTLACGDKGPGKLMKPRHAVIAVNQNINCNSSKKTVLVTSGGTKALIDGVRVVTNISSGALGAIVIDELLMNTGYKVIHVAPKMSINSSLGATFPERYTFVRADTVDEVYAAMEKHVPKSDAVIHSMAISDFTFNTDEECKIKSDDMEGFIASMEKSICKSPKIIAKVKEWNPNTILVGFKFEVGAGIEELFELGKKQMESCGSEFVFVNDKAAMKKAGKHIGHLLCPYKNARSLCGKSEIAKGIVEAVHERLTNGPRLDRDKD